MLVIACAGALVAVAGVSALLRPDLALVQEVSFHGHDRASTAELRHLAGLPNGARIWQLDLAAIERGVAEHPWVDSVQARFEWPATVRVQVTERVPVALLRGEHLRYVDAAGDPIVLATTDDLDYPVFSDIDPELVARAPDLRPRVVRAGLELIELFAEIPDIPSERISEVAFSPTTGFAVHLVSGARILLRHDDFERQLQRLRELRARGVSIDAPVHIDLAPQSMAIVRPIESPRTEVPRAPG